MEKKEKKETKKEEVDWGGFLWSCRDETGNESWSDAESVDSIQCIKEQLILFITISQFNYNIM